jgi:hypothetical protein
MVPYRNHYSSFPRRSRAKVFARRDTSSTEQPGTGRSRSFRQTPNRGKGTLPGQQRVPCEPAENDDVVDGLIGSEILLEYEMSGNFVSPSWASLRSREVQYIEYYDDTGEVIFRELYDLIRDEWQVTNFAGGQKRPRLRCGRSEPASPELSHLLGA